MSRLPDPTEWAEAFREAEDNRPRRLDDLMERDGVPAFAIERLRALLRKARFPKRTPRVDQLADAYADMTARLDDGQPYRIASAIVCEKRAIRQGALDNLMAGKRSDVNPVLRERGLLSGKFTD